MSTLEALMCSQDRGVKKRRAALASAVLLVPPMAESR
jgi:hypothetical protein